MPFFFCGWTATAAGSDFSILAGPSALIDASGKPTDTTSVIALIDSGDVANEGKGQGTIFVSLPITSNLHGELADERGAAVR
jgi:hypothetical protein